MSAIRSRDNKTEVALRRAIHALGLRFRLHSSRVVGKPDIVFAKERVAVFIDGDYWHARQLREHGLSAVRETLRTPNKDYWLQKFSRRVQRDDEVSDQLQREGWLVLRYWESEVKENVVAIAALVARQVRKRRQRRKPHA